MTASISSTPFSAWSLLAIINRLAMLITVKECNPLSSAPSGSGDAILPKAAAGIKAGGDDGMSTVSSSFPDDDDSSSACDETSSSP